MRNVFVVLLLIASLCCSNLYSASGSTPVGITIYNAEKLYNTNVIFSAPDGNTHLVDIYGNEIKRWPYTGFPSEYLDPNVVGKKGQVLLQLQNGTGIWNGIFSNKSIGEVDWTGNVVWKYDSIAHLGDVRQNHDLDRLQNGNTLLITSVHHIVKGVSKNPIGDQTIIEVDKNNKIVWSWNAGEHIDEFGISQEGRKLLSNAYKNGDKGHGFLTINDMQPIGPNKWYDAGDNRFHPDNIVIDSREASFIAIIDKRSGKIVWRLGPDFENFGLQTDGKANFATASLRPSLKVNVPRIVDQLSGQHDAHIIPKGLPGAGNLLVFDNEGPSGYPPVRISTQAGSRVLEINPVTKEIVWQYTALDSNQPLWNFYSSFISSARRLPNGNTLIDEGMNGRIFQVTTAGEVVWEYVNPFFGETTQNGTQKVRTNWVFRAQPVPNEWLPVYPSDPAKAVYIPLKPENFTPYEVSLKPVVYKGKECLNVIQTKDTDFVYTFARLKDIDFHNGMIEVLVAGEPKKSALQQGARGFVGISFRVAADTTVSETFYIRPTNGRADDQIRRNHSLQYISHPGYPWQRLRKEYNEKYESYADIQPGEWTKLKIVVKDDKAWLYVNNALQPNLVVNDLKQGQNARGSIAIWIAVGTIAHFSDLKITKWD